MSKSRSNSRRNSHRQRDNGYEVGYGRPPKKTQFKPGQSGNPKGRPKGAKNEATILHEIMIRKVGIQEAGRTRKISVLAAILLRFAENALKGDAKAATFLLNRYGRDERDIPHTDGLSQDDRELLDFYVRDFKTRQRGAK